MHHGAQRHCEVLKIVVTLFVYVNKCAHEHETEHTWRSEDSSQEATLSFHPVGLRNQTQMVSTGGKRLYLLNHLAGLTLWSFVQSGIQSISYSVAYICMLCTSG